MFPSRLQGLLHHLPPTPEIRELRVSRLPGIDKSRNSIIGQSPASEACPKLGNKLTMPSTLRRTAHNLHKFLCEDFFGTRQYLQLLLRAQDFITDALLPLPSTSTCIQYLTAVLVCP
jgi:hypothetical protein